MGEAPVREDGTVTRSAEVTPKQAMCIIYFSVFFFNVCALSFCEVCGLISC